MDTRIALCLSGLVRNFVHFAPLIANFCSKYNPDIFISTWDIIDVNHPNNSQFYQYFIFTLRQFGLINYVKDIRIAHWEPDRFAEFNYFDYKREHVNSQYMVNYASLFYHIYHANLLRKQYNKTYDWVIRHRFDFAFKVPLEIDKLQSEYLYLLPINREDGYNDIWAMSNPNIMNNYSSVFLYLHETYQRIKFSRPEDILKQHIDHCNTHTCIRILDIPYHIKVIAND